MSAFDAETLANQLAALGRDLQSEVIILGGLEEYSVDCEGEYRRLETEYEDQLDRALLAAEGTMELRKAAARIKCSPAKIIMLDAGLDWSRAKGKIRTQNANLTALRSRIDIGRSLLSRERALLSLTSSGVDT
jgi:hypothetical protein